MHRTASGARRWTVLTLPKNLPPASHLSVSLCCLTCRSSRVLCPRLCLHVLTTSLAPRQLHYKRVCCCSLNSHGVVSDHASWIYEIIDVVGSNYKFYSPKGIPCTARRGDDLPHPRSSDHWHVGLRWSSAKTKRKPPESSDNIVHRLIPSWLLDNAEFQRVADECFDLWFANRDSGLAGLSSSVGTMYDCSTKFLSTHVIVATTARQRLESALTAMRLLERHPIDERRLSRLCAADCDLSAIIELHVDLDVFDSTSVLLHVLERVAERCRVQADVVLVESPARPDILSDPAEGFRGHRQHESTQHS